MPDRLILPLGNGEFLALSAEDYEAARKAAADKGWGVRSPSAAFVAAPEPLCDAEQLAVALSVPESWVAQAARDGRIPCLKLGRWVRFRRSDVEAALTEVNGQSPRRRPR